MNDTDLMEMRREMERLKAAVEELGRRIEDQADAEATPLRVEAGNGIEVQEAGGAWRVSAALAGGASVSVMGESVVARVVSGDSVAGYVVTCYPAFPSTAGSFAAKLAVLDIALGATLPEDTYLIAHLAGLSAIGGN